MTPPLVLFVLAAATTNPTSHVLGIQMPEWGASEQSTRALLGKKFPLDESPGPDDRNWKTLLWDRHVRLGRNTFTRVEFLFVGNQLQAISLWYPKGRMDQASVEDVNAALKKAIPDAPEVTRGCASVWSSQGTIVAHVPPFLKFSASAVFARIGDDFKGCPWDRSWEWPPLPGRRGN